MIKRVAILVVLFSSSLFLIAAAFECHTCNMDSDNEECVDAVETCEPGVESCTMVTFTSKGQVHVRKFCTSPGTPIYQYLLFFPGSALCQNINTSNDHRRFAQGIRVENDVDIEPSSDLVGPPAQQPTTATTLLNDSQTLHRAKRVRRNLAEPPAPPSQFSTSLLCVCSTEKCNSGSPQEVLSRLMLSQLPKKLPSKFVKKPTNKEFQPLRA